MLNPALGDLIAKYDSRYDLVADVAKRARKISRKAENSGVILEEKPVTIALEEINKETPAESEM
ncbi:MAG: DNA-directed RNA polymerase subunit omega [Clostridia bacterium]|nr:DNA-directed RNA polymerase subunit omega [Clostridia bacterium]